MFRGVAWVLALSSPELGAQTIADYSRAQRAMLEAAMTQAAARSAGPGAPAAAASVPIAAATNPPAAAQAAIASRMAPPPPPPSPAVQVSGVFATSAGSLAEVVVDATAYLLCAGEGVPGTAWHVETVAVDRVVLSRQGRGAAADAEGSRRTFALPALR
jgi:hypothetical protein